MPSTFSDLFEELFRDSGLSSEAVQKCTNDFLVIALLHIIGLTEKKLSQPDKEHLHRLLEIEDYSRLTVLLSSQYSDQEWNVLLEQEIAPLLRDYVESVLL